MPPLTFALLAVPCDHRGAHPQLEAEQAEAAESVAKHFADALPRLIEKYSSEPAVLRAVLTVLTFMDLAVFAEKVVLAGPRATDDVLTCHGRPVPLSARDSAQCRPPP